MCDQVCNRSSKCRTRRLPAWIWNVNRVVSLLAVEVAAKRRRITQCECEILENGGNSWIYSECAECRSCVGDVGTCVDWFSQKIESRVRYARRNERGLAGNSQQLVTEIWLLLGYNRRQLICSRRWILRARD